MTNVKYAPEEPIAAVATALAPAALGIVRCSGRNCIELVSDIFSRPRTLCAAAGNTLVYGWIQKDGEKIDEVMISVYRAPKSFTGEDMIEISCHGGPGVVMAVLSLLLKSGFRQAERGEFTFRAFINGKADLTKAEAVQEIISSRTGEARSRAAGRLAGNLFAEIDAIKKRIVDTLASIEAEIEYPEDEETIAETFDTKNLEEAAARLESLKNSWRGEKLYQDGARVVLCGRTNAGKSSLFNAILKEERAIVSEVEGTTRDWIESQVDFDGIPVRLFDTAGIRRTDDAVEAHGVELAKDLSADADVVLYLADATVGIAEDDRNFLAECTEPVVFIWNKCDKDGAKTASLSVHELQQNIRAVLELSAKNGSGFDKLYKAVKAVLTAGIPAERAHAGLGSARQKSAVEEALESVRHAIDAAEERYTLDAVVEDLESALDALGEITGDVSADDILESVFSRFCVGK